MNSAEQEIDRGQEVLDTAEAIMLENRTLAISLNDIADKIGVSRTLIYVYYDGVPAIFDALFRDHMERLDRCIRPVVESDNPFSERAVDAHIAYLDYLIEAGPVLQLIIRERKQDSPLGAESLMRFRAMLKMLATDVASTLDLRPREAFILLELTAAIPEALSRLVRSGEIDYKAAATTTTRLVNASIGAFNLPQAAP